MDKYAICGVGLTIAGFFLSYLVPKDNLTLQRGCGMLIGFGICLISTNGFRGKS